MAVLYVIANKMSEKYNLNHTQQIKKVLVTQQVLTWSESRRARAEPSQRKKNETQTAGGLTEKQRKSGHN